ncbi:MAG: hypothetical protein OEX07_08545 [Gammaproteobacteria bacterium]|nr:hypothetical protein [Gammaproteobacteria bacterium]
MSSKKFAAPLHLDVGSSRLLLILLFCLHGFSLVLLFLMPLNLLLLMMSTILILTSGVYSILYQAKKRLPSSVTALIWDIVDDWYVLDKQGNKTAAVLDGNSFVHPWITILNFKLENHRFSRSVILLKDNINSNDARRLRVRLKVTRQNSTLDPV